jgi:hypothetical protein
LEAAKVGELSFQDRRHSFASWLVMRDEPSALRDMFDQQDLKLTLRYAHLPPDTRAPKSRSPPRRSAQSPHDLLQSIRTSRKCLNRRGSSEAEQLIRNQ